MTFVLTFQPRSARHSPLLPTAPQLLKKRKKKLKQLLQERKNVLQLLLRNRKLFARAKTKLLKSPSRHSSSAAKCASPQKILLTEYLKTPKKLLQLPLPKLKEPAQLLTSSKKPHRQTHSPCRNKTEDKTGALLPFFITHRSPQMPLKQTKTAKILHKKARFLQNGLFCFHFSPKGKKNSDFSHK